MIKTEYRKPYKHKETDVQIARAFLKPSDEIIPPDFKVGTFGIIDDANRAINITWKVTGTRRDKRHGYIGTPVGFSRYSKSLLDSIFRGWE